MKIGSNRSQCCAVVQRCSLFFEIKTLFFHSNFFCFVVNTSFADIYHIILIRSQSGQLPWLSWLFYRFQKFFWVICLTMVADWFLSRAYSFCLCRKFSSSPRTHKDDSYTKYLSQWREPCGSWENHTHWSSWQHRAYSRVGCGPRWRCIHRCHSFS